MLLCQHTRLDGQRPAPWDSCFFWNNVNTEQCTAWRVRARSASRSRRGPVVRQLGNGRAVSGVGRLIRQSLRSTRAHARASIRAHAPTVHTPAHISMILHKHDTSTFLHLQADMLTPQRRERARLGRGGRLKARHGTAPPDIRRCGPLRGLQPPQHEAAGRFADAVQMGGMNTVGRCRPDRAARDGLLVIRWPQMPARKPRGRCSIEHARLAS